MKRGLWVLATLAVVGLALLLWGTGAISPLPGEPSVESKVVASTATPSSKPICPSTADWNIARSDCIPAYLANLPPDPGAKGMEAIEGIDADGDGVRDDVQRFIAQNYGHSDRAVRALRGIAISTQMAVLLGDSISRDEAKKLAPKVLNAADCYSRSVDEKIKSEGALNLVEIEVTNTPERHIRASKFWSLFANQIYPLSNLPTSDLCGYDPEKLPN